MRNTSDGLISAAGKRSLIIFTTYRCGTANDVRNVISFTLRTLPAQFSSETGQNFSDETRRNCMRLEKRVFDEIEGHISMMVSTMETLSGAMMGIVKSRSAHSDADARNKK
eukprot:IDg4914t1